MKWWRGWKWWGEVGTPYVAFSLVGPLIIFGFTVVALFTAETRADRALAAIIGLAAIAAVMAIGLAAESYAEQRRARLEDAADREVRRLEAIAELVLQIAEAAYSGAQSRWALARRRLNVALDAIGSDVDLAATRGLAELDVSYEALPKAAARAKPALDEIGDRFADVQNAR
jgi:hypothetical protein